MTRYYDPQPWETAQADQAQAEADDEYGYDDQLTEEELAELEAAARELEELGLSNGYEYAAARLDPTDPRDRAIVMGYAREFVGELAAEGDLPGARRMLDEANAEIASFVELAHQRNTRAEPPVQLPRSATDEDRVAANLDRLCRGRSLVAEFASPSQAAQDLAAHRWHGGGVQDAWGDLDGLELDIGDGPDRGPGEILAAMQAEVALVDGSPVRLPYPGVSALRERLGP